MKSRVKLLVCFAFLSLVLFSGNAGANDKEAVVVSGLENINEVELEVKSWMVNETCWLRADAGYDLEESLIIEPWMLDKEKWNVVTAVLAVETEAGLAVEPWMTGWFLMYIQSL